jgi:hypothetical protein
MMSGRRRGSNTSTASEVIIGEDDAGTGKERGRKIAVAGECYQAR